MKIKLKTERMKGNGPGIAAKKGWGFQPNYLYGLDDLCKKFVNGQSTMLEIGCNRGISTSLFCEYAGSVVAIDPNYTPEMQELVESSDNLTFHKETSITYVPKIQKEGLKYDFIYIDADHHYKPVLRDIRLSLTILKSPGVLAGHDMNPNDPGVLQAVNEFFPGIMTGETILHRFSDSSWAIEL
jgi:predicted O-methyltransferase YrrM